MEARAKRQTTSALRKLIDLQPATARVLRNATELEVPVGDVRQDDTIGIRPGEKLHEVMVPEDDARTTVSLEDRFVIMPAFPWFEESNYRQEKLCASGFSYSSDKNDRWLTRDELVTIVGRLTTEPRRDPQ